MERDEGVSMPEDLRLEKDVDDDLMHSSHAPAPYLHLPGVGDVLLFPTDRDAFSIRVARGLALAVERDTNADVRAVT